MIGPHEIEAALAAHGRVVAVVVTETKGSSPRDAAAVMLVFNGGTLGTIGGGTVEYQCITEAHKLLAEGGAPQEHQFPLGPDLDQCCGGHMAVSVGLVRLTQGAPPRSVAAECLPNPEGVENEEQTRLWPDGPPVPQASPRRPVIIYGSGHVGQALARALTPLPFRISMVDPRPGPTAPEGTSVFATPLPEAVAEEAGPDTFHIVLTHSHAVDLEIVTTILAKRFGFCGLIGSATKRAVFERRLRERGVSEEVLGNLTCPIGLPMLRDKRPEVIAASVAVQLLLRDSVLRKIS